MKNSFEVHNNSLFQFYFIRNKVSGLDYTKYINTTLQTIKMKNVVSIHGYETDQSFDKNG